MDLIEQEFIYNQYENRINNILRNRINNNIINWNTINMSNIINISDFDIMNNNSHDNYISCIYCGEMIENTLNEYVNHILNSNHIESNINDNNYFINRLRNNEITFPPDININIQNNTIYLENFSNITELYKFIISNLSELELSILNETLISENYSEYNPLNQDLNSSQEYLDIIKNILINFEYLDNNGNLINTNKLDQNGLNELFYINRFNRFNNLDILDDNDFEYINEEDDLNNNSGLELENYSKEYLLSEESECSICLQTYKVGEKFNEMICAHKFCNKCCNLWFSKNLKCPLCNINLKLNKNNYEIEK